MLRTTPLLRIFFLMVPGIILGEYFSFPFLTREIIIMMLGIILVICPCVWLFKTLGSLMPFIIFTLGILHIKLHDPNIKDHYSHDSYPFSFGKIISVKPGKNYTRYEYILKYGSPDSTTWFHTGGRVWLYFKSNLPGQPSNCDFVILKKKLQPVRENNNPLSFNYKKYLARQHIYHQVFLEEKDFSILGHPSGKPVLDHLKEIRSSVIQKLLVDPMEDREKAVAKAMLFGSREDLEPGLTKAFTGSGAVHILAVSGLHVGIVASIALFVTSFLRQTLPATILRTCLIISWIWIYIFLAGNGLAAQRAGIMFTFLSFGYIMHRVSHPMNILAGAAILLVFIDPLVIFQLGFQMSFLAVAGIMIFYEPFSGLINIKNTYINYFWKISAVSISAQLTVLPLSLHVFHILPHYFLLTGLAAIPLAFIVISLGLSSMLALHLPLISSIGYNLIIPVFNFSLRILNKCVTGIYSLPYSITEDIWISKTALIIYYMNLLLLFMIVKKPKMLRIVFLIAGTLLLIAFQAWENRMAGSKQHCVVYDDRNLSLIEFYHHKHCISYSTSGLPVEEEKYIAGNYRMAHRVRVIERRKMKQRTILFGNVKVHINHIPSDQVPHEASDILIITAGLKDTIGLSSFTGKVIIDGTTDPQIRQGILEQLTDGKIHDTRTQGAFIYEI